MSGAQDHAAAALEDRDYVPGFGVDLFHVEGCRVVPAEQAPFVHDPNWEVKAKARCFDEWIELTNWVQDEALGAPGTHRATAMRNEIHRLRAAVEVAEGVLKTMLADLSVGKPTPLGELRKGEAEEALKQMRGGLPPAVPGFGVLGRQGVRIAARQAQS